MARAVSLSVLETRVRQRANLEGATAFLAQAELDDNINESIAELYDLLRASYGPDYFISSTTFNTVNGAETYALPADFLSANGVDIQFGQNIVLTARPFMRNERNRLKWYPGWVYSKPVFYRIEGQNIRFIPTPSGAYSITLWYTPTPTKLSSGSDTFDGIAGWEEYVVLDAAIKALLKDGQLDVVQVLEGRKALMRQRIEQLAAQRDIAAPDRIQDVTLTDEWGGMPGA